VLESTKHSLAECAACRIGWCAFRLTAAEGVAEIAAIAGFERQYQIVVDPRKLQAFSIPLARVTEAVRAGNRDVGGRTIENERTNYGAGPRLCPRRRGSRGHRAQGDSAPARRCARRCGAGRARPR